MLPDQALKTITGGGWCGERGGTGAGAGWLVLAAASAKPKTLEFVLLFVLLIIFSCHKGNEHSL